MNRVDKELQRMREIVESMKLPQDHELTRLHNLKPITPEDIKNHRTAWNKITKGKVK
jgi:hypothetical protein